MAFTKSASQATRILIFSMAMIVVAQGIHVGFYNDKCNGLNVEEIIHGVVKNHFDNIDQRIVASLLRMQFHDCFVRGCDASILLDGDSVEKEAGANGSVRDYELIDDVKAALEEKCPGVVSCADIIVVTTRDAVHLQTKFKYEVQTGRRDGRVSRSIDASTSLPSPSISVSQALEVFGDKGLTKEDFVLLLGGHTVGITHCSFVRSRLYTFNATHDTDPSMNKDLVAKLQGTCPRDESIPDSAIFLDQTPGSENLVDDGFFRAIKQAKGVLQIDQRIADDPLTKSTVDELLKQDFLLNFGKAMVNLGKLAMPKDDPREVRTSCRAVNKVSQSNASRDKDNGFLVGRKLL